MTDFAIIYPLAGFTLLVVIVLGVWQVRRMKRLKGRTEPSSLARDGDPHHEQRL